MLWLWADTLDLLMLFISMIHRRSSLAKSARLLTKLLHFSIVDLVNMLQNFWVVLDLIEIDRKFCLFISFLININGSEVCKITRLFERLWSLMFSDWRGSVFDIYDILRWTAAHLLPIEFKIILISIHCQKWLFSFTSALSFNKNKFSLIPSIL